MTHPSYQPPRPTEELTSDALDLSVRQREVLAALGLFPSGARIAELSEKMGIHVNTLRGHLDELIKHGAVDAVTAPVTGRGRPSHIYRVRVPNNRAVTREYVALIELLAGEAFNQDRLSPEDFAVAREVGRKWAHAVDPTVNSGEDEDGVEKLLSKLRALGFDPELRPTSPRAIGLKACPFVTADRPVPMPFVCALHEGYLRESAGLPRSEELRIIPFDAPGQCGVHLPEEPED